jgi:carbonic anhydrase/acetyltransferase-like protein (isoleucine patch superfamily)
MNTEKTPRTFRFLMQQPVLGEGVYIAPEAHVSGAVEIGSDVSFWPMAVARGDVNRIVIGARSKVQDNCVLHVTHESDWQPEGGPLHIGEDVTIGHAAVLHACTIGDRCLVGMGAIVMDGAVIEADAMVAAGSVVPPGKTVASGTLWRGNPARYARDLTTREIDYLLYSARHYVKLKNLYLEEAR